MRTMGLLVDIQHHRETIAVLAQRDSQRMDRVAFLPAAADVQLFGVADPQHIQEAEVRFQFLFLLRILQPDMAQIAEQRLRVLPEVQHRLEHLFLHSILTAQRQLHVIHIQDRIAVAGQELFAFAQLDQRHADIAFCLIQLTDDLCALTKPLVSIHDDIPGRRLLPIRAVLAAALMQHLQQFLAEELDFSGIVGQIAHGIVLPPQVRDPAGKPPELHLFFVVDHCKAQVLIVVERCQFHQHAQCLPEHTFPLFANNAHQLVPAQIQCDRHIFQAGHFLDFFFHIPVQHRNLTDLRLRLTDQTAGRFQIPAANRDLQIICIRRFALPQAAPAVLTGTHGAAGHLSVAAARHRQRDHVPFQRRIAQLEVEHLCLAFLFHGLFQLVQVGTVIRFDFHLLSAHLTLLPPTVEHRHKAADDHAQHHDHTGNHAGQVGSPASIDRKHTGDEHCQGHHDTRQHTHQGTALLGHRRLRRRRLYPDAVLYREQCRCRSNVERAVMLRLDRQRDLFRCPGSRQGAMQPRPRSAKADRTGTDEDSQAAAVQRIARMGLCAVNAHVVAVQVPRR